MPFNRDGGDPITPGAGTGGGIGESPNPAVTPSPATPVVPSSPGGITQAEPRLTPPQRSSGGGRRRIVTPGNPVPEEPITTPVVPPLPEWPSTPPPTLTPSPVKPPSRALERSITHNARGVPSRVIYGKVENVGLQLANWRVLTDGRVLVRYVVCYGPIQSISNLKIEDRSFASAIGLGTYAYNPVYNAYVGYELYLGYPTQAVSPAMIAEVPGWQQTRYPGIAHVICVFPSPAMLTVYGSKAIPDITKVTATVEGSLVYNSITDPTLTNKYYSENTAFCLADFFNAKRYGGRIAKERINYSFIASDTAPWCDELIAVGKKRYDLGIVIELNQEFEQIVENLRAHAQLFVSYNNGMYNIIADKPRTWSGITFDDDNGLEGSSLRIKGSGEVYSQVTVNFTDVSNNSQEAPAEAELSGVALGTREFIPQTYTLSGIRTYQMARRLATYILNRSIQDKEITFIVNSFGAKAVPGDRVKLTDVETNLSNQDVVIVDCKPQGDMWIFNAEIYSEAVFSDVIQETPVVVSPASPSPFDPLPAPTTPTIEVQYEATEETTYIPKAIITFVPAGTGGVRLTMSINGGAHQELGIFSTSPVRITLNESPGSTLVVRAYSVHPLSGQSSSLYSETAPYVITQVIPEPIEVVEGPNPFDSWWDKPPVRANLSLASGAFTQTGALTLFTPSLLRDGAIGAAAVRFTAGSTGGTKVDLGSSQAIREVLLDFSSNYLIFALMLFYSDDGVNYFNYNGNTPYATVSGQSHAIPFTNPTPLSPDSYPSFSVVNGTHFVISIPSSVGSHRYWWIEHRAVTSELQQDGLGTPAASLNEVTFVTFTGARQQLIKGYKLRGWAPDTSQSFLDASPEFSGLTQELEIYYQPTSLKTLNRYFHQKKFNRNSKTGTVAGSTRTYLEIATISPTNNISEWRLAFVNFTGFGASGSPEGVVQSYQPIEQMDLNISGGGTQHDLEITNYAGVIRLMGTTSTTSIDGLKRGYEGREVKIVNAGPHTVSLLNNVGSTVGNRFNFDHTLPVGSEVDVWYDPDAGFWKRVASYNFDWSLILNKPTAITRIQNITGGLGSIDVGGSTAGWSGIHFPDAYNSGAILLNNAASIFGLFDSSGWIWRVNAGVMDFGTVPYGSVTGKPDLRINTGTYGSFQAHGTTTGYSGIYFPDSDSYLMIHPNFQGVMKHSTLAWQWYFTNGVLTVGSVPGANLTGSLPANYTLASSPAAGDNSTKVASTAFVQSSLGSYLYVSAVQSTSATALQDITNLGFAVAANEVWEFEYVILFQSNNAANGIRLSMQCPTSPTMINWLTRWQTSTVATAGTDIFSERTDNTPGTTLIQGTVPIINTNLMIFISGVIRNGANAGNVRPQFGGGNGTNTTGIQIGSKGWARKLA